jgi:ATP-dependent DNA ligase
MPWPAIAQIKLDGMRFNAIVKNGSVTFRSRNGKELAINSPLLIKAFTDMATNIGMTEVVFDGELLVADETGNYLDRQTGNGILNKAGKGTISDDESAQVRAIVWDLIPVIHFEAGKCPVPYAERLETLSIAVNNLGYNLEHLVAVVETTYVTDRNQAQKVFTQYYAEGQEGIILKSASGIWEDKRAKHQIKYKGELECDLKVVGVEEGTGKYRGMLGAIICESADGVVKVSVGSGFNDAQRKEGVPVGSIVAVKYNQRIKNVNGDESLFLPIFVEIRSDKDKADKSKDIK